MTTKRGSADPALDKITLPNICCSSCVLCGRATDTDQPILRGAFRILGNRESAGDIGGRLGDGQEPLVSLLVADPGIRVAGEAGVPRPPRWPGFWCCIPGVAVLDVGAPTRLRMPEVGLPGAQLVQRRRESVSIMAGMVCCVLEQICGTDMAASAIYGLWSRELASVADARIRATWVPGR